MKSKFSENFKSVKVTFKDLTGLNADEHLDYYLPFFNAWVTDRVDQGTDLIREEVENLKKEVAKLKEELERERA